MSKIAIIAALEREVKEFTRGWVKSERPYRGHSYTLYEQDEFVVVTSGVGMEAGRSIAEAVIELVHPAEIWSVGFAGALQDGLRVGHIVTPAVVIDARDGSRIPIQGGEGSLITFMGVVGAEQKRKLADAYGAHAVDMEAAAVGRTAGIHSIPFRAIKAISDDFHFEMPDMDRFVDSSGRFQALRFAGFLSVRPLLWKQIFVLARNSGKAANALHGYLRLAQADYVSAGASAGERMNAAATPADTLHARG